MASLETIFLQGGVGQYKNPLCLFAAWVLARFKHFVVSFEGRPSGWDGSALTLGMKKTRV